jgi:hypothetical protein
MKHVLIVGAPRSGTSLLTWLLGSQDGIALSSEVNGKAWYRVVGHDVVGVKLCVPEQIQLRPQTPVRRNLKRIEKHLSRPLHRVFGPPFHRPHTPAKMSIEDFLEFENPHVICVVRDPHEVVGSIMKRGDEPRWAAQRMYKSAIDIIYSVWNENPDRVSLVDFDKLVERPAAIVGNLCRSIGVDFDEERLSGYTKNYSRSSVDSKKGGGRCVESKLDHPVFRKNPDVSEKYRVLINHCDG